MREDFENVHNDVEDEGEGLTSEAVAVDLLTEAVPVVDNHNVGEVQGGNILVAVTAVLWLKQSLFLTIIAMMKRRLVQSLVSTIMLDVQKMMMAI